MPIVTQNLTHVYTIGKQICITAVRDVNLTIEDGEMVGLIGATGSGKSTLVQHFNGLLRPTSGKVVVDEVELNSPAALKEARRKVGLIFQYPEHQLFEETVFADIAFGPKNMGIEGNELTERVREAMDLVGLDWDLRNRSPFELSGGQMRRVAIAGVIATRPRYLILDEPTAGLDPRGRDEILGRIKELHDRMGVTVILVSHNMEDVARLVGRLLVMSEGEIVMDGSPREVFREPLRLQSLGLNAPQVTLLMARLAEKGVAVRGDVLTVAEARDELLTLLGARKGEG